VIDFIQVGRRPAAPSPWAAFRYREVDGDVLLTSYLGDWVFVSKEEFLAMVRGEVGEGSPLYDRLASRGFVRDRIDPEQAADRLRRKKRFLDAGPNLHVMVVTLRCNESCVYCHAARADMTETQTDMTPEIAEKAVELALQTTSPSVTIEFQGASRW
jgi:sulfatase maturation enzyme AslB (radical SAM superfamily)